MGVYMVTYNFNWDLKNHLPFASVVISNFVLGLLLSQLQFQMTPGWSLSSLVLLNTSERRFKFYILEGLKRIDKK